MNYEKLVENLVELIRRTSCYLPPDVNEVLSTKKALEVKKSKAELALEVVMQNIGLARHYSRPICQDTGLLNFYIHHPFSVDPRIIKKATEEATKAATVKGYLRQNSVDSLTGKNSGTNLGPGSPAFHMDVWDNDEIEIKLIQKGGGCENMSAQFKLPTTIAGQAFGRDLNGVRACILETVHMAQGKGCAPGFLGVCIGGDRAAAYEFAKMQLLRPLDDTNPDEKLAQLEAEVLESSNRLSIGPMGFEGNLTVGGIKIGMLNRLPACYFVTIAYMCWAHRRRGFVLSSDGAEVKQWQYQTDWEFTDKDTGTEKFELPKDAKVVNINLPMDEETVRSLNVGDVVMLNGIICTARDAVHKYLFDGADLDIIKGGVIYHCGPVVLENPYRIMAAGPTTSIREEPYQAEIIKRFDVKAVIGKGGMGPKTLEACKEHGAVYLHAIGGAAQVYAMAVKEVKEVFLKEEFGSPEAVWVMDVVDFPVVVTMDSKGISLHQVVEKKSESNTRIMMHKKPH